MTKEIPIYGSGHGGKSLFPEFTKKMIDEGWDILLGHEIDDEDDSPVYRQWGYYKVLHKGDGYTVKELTILPGKSLSDQRHFKRDEHWLVVKGTLMVELQHEKQFSGKAYTVLLTNQDWDQGRGLANYTILKETWHRPHNDTAENVVVVETWMGESSEDDIERRNI